MLISFFSFPKTNLVFCARKNTDYLSTAFNLLS